MTGWMWTALIAAGVVVVIVRRFRGEPLTLRDLCGPPLILLGIGTYELTKVDVLDPRDVLWTVGAALVGVALGGVRGTTTVLFVRGGHLWQKYTVGTVLVWVVSLGINAGVGWLAATVGGMHAEARQITLSVGAGLLGEMVIVGARALRTGERVAVGR